MTDEAETATRGVAERAAPGSFLREMGDPGVVRRALAYAAVVGCVLVAINQGDRILQGHVGGREWAKMALTVVVPYLVSTFSSVSARREARRSSGGSG